MDKPKVYLICDYTDDKAKSIGGTPNIGVEYMGNCHGRIVDEDGDTIGLHYSSSFGWLKHDLIRNLDNPDEYEIIDLIGQITPERFRLDNQ